jgi:hypothetical protein
MRSMFGAPCLATLLLTAPIAAWADGTGGIFKHTVAAWSSDKPLNFLYAPYTKHFSKSEFHEYVWLVGLEKESPGNALIGATFFSNSFGQPSTYIYPFGGVYRNVLDINGLFVKWSAGLIYGYLEPFNNKVPFNNNGFSPGFIPAVGYQSQNFSAQINILNDAGLMLQLNWPLSGR